MNIQEVFAKVSSSIGSQTKSVNSAMHQLDKDQSANCSIRTGLILDSQDSSIIVLKLLPCHHYHIYI